MSNLEPGDPLAANVRTLQIIAISLVLGVTVFLAITVLVIRSGKFLAPDPWSLDPTTPISLAAIVMAIGIVPAAFFVPRAIANQNRKGLARGKVPITPGDDRAAFPPGEPGYLIAIYQTQTIVGFALLEGAAFFATIAFMIEGKAIPLILALGLIVLMLARFPSRPRIDVWMEEQGRLLADDRLVG